MNEIEDEYRGKIIGDSKERQGKIILDFRNNFNNENLYQFFQKSIPPSILRIWNHFIASI